MLRYLVAKNRQNLIGARQVGVAQHALVGAPDGHLMPPVADNCKPCIFSRMPDKARPSLEACPPNNARLIR
jgi:hypothetical protein